MSLEYHDPPNTLRLAPGADLSAMLMAGEIDAGIALTGLDPAQVRTVIPDADAQAADWFRRIGAYPVNHVVCVKRALLEQHDWLEAELMHLFTGAKQAAARRAPSHVGKPSSATTCFRYGLAANRRGIELCVDFAAQQGLIPRVYRPGRIVRRCPDLKELSHGHSSTERRDQGAGSASRPSLPSRPARSPPR